MADQKLSELTELAAEPASNDEVYIRDVSEVAADESKRITVANLLANSIAHKANTTTAHGAVSAATASKHVVRDASARAKFAAPGASGDALIKGTRITAVELPAVTDEYYLVGTGGNMEERAVPTGVAITEGNYTGDNSVNRAIPHGLGRTPKEIHIYQIGASPTFWLFNGEAVIRYNSNDRDTAFAVTIMNSTNFYIGNATSYPDSANNGTINYYWKAYG